jgi:hypothetical protein
MLRLAGAIEQLRKERELASRTLDRLDMALKALTDGAGKSPSRVHTQGRKRRTLSAAARKRIAAAQRARWAKWKAAKQRK